MKDNKYLYCLYVSLFCSLIFSENEILWDFGVMINQSDNQINPNNKNSKYPNNNQVSQIKIKALITDPFIPPIRNTFPLKNPDSIVHQISEEIIKLNLKGDIFQISKEAKKFYFKKNYTYVIELLHKRDLSSLTDTYRHDLEYLIAEAFYQTGKYKKAQEQVLLLLTQNETDRLCMLLAIIYEALGEKRKARECYLEIIAQYPESDYAASAQIKSRILGPH